MPLNPHPCQLALTHATQLSPPPSRHHSCHPVLTYTAQPSPLPTRPHLHCAALTSPVQPSPPPCSPHLHHAATASAVQSHLCHIVCTYTVPPSPCHPAGTFIVTQQELEEGRPWSLDVEAQSRLGLQRSLNGQMWSCVLTSNGTC